jgi:ornithine cyclodeaminase/alanine dehydrogenase-like protein (mu-crystallin family)
MSKAEFIYLSQEDVIAAGGLNMEKCMEAVEEALACHARGDMVLPSKTVVRWRLRDGSHHGRFNAMQATLEAR